MLRMFPIVNSTQEATVIGVGAIGRQVAIDLISLGVPRIRLTDFDRVDGSNIASQGYELADVGRLKVHAAAEALRRLNPSVEVETVPDRFRPGQPVGEVVFTCVDSVLARAAIWRACQDLCQFWCDGRMLKDVVRVLTIADGAGQEHYQTSLFSPERAQGSTCAHGGQLHVAAIAAGLMVNQFCRWQNGQPVEHDTVFNLKAIEIGSPEFR